MRAVLSVGVAGLLLFGIASIAAAQEAGAPFTVARLLCCTAVKDREPVDTATTFPSGSGYVFAFLEARGIKADTTVTFVWLHDGRERRASTVELPAGPRWRTFDGKIPHSWRGEWTVEIRDASGKAVSSTSFTVE